MNRVPKGFEELRHGPYDKPTCTRCGTKDPEDNWMHPRACDLPGGYYCCVSLWKMVLVPVAGLNMSPGKLAAQAAHVSAWLWDLATADFTGDVKLDKDDYCSTIYKEWFLNGQKTLVLEAQSLDRLQHMERLAKALELPTLLWWDRGLTEIDDGYTMLGIGPAPDSEIDMVTGHLDLYRPAPWWKFWRR